MMAFVDVFFARFTGCATTKICSFKDLKNYQKIFCAQIGSSKFLSFVLSFQKFFFFFFFSKFNFQLLRRAKKKKSRNFFRLIKNKKLTISRQLTELMTDLLNGHLFFCFLPSLFAFCFCFLLLCFFAFFFFLLLSTCFLIEYHNKQFIIGTYVF